MKLLLNEDGLLDIVMDEKGGVVQETTVKTAILASLLLNRRADSTDTLPHGYQGKGGTLTDDRQGWPGDVLDGKGRLVGSKLWLLDQELATNETCQRAIQYIREALQWTIDDGYVSEISIKDEWGDQNRLNLEVHLSMISGDSLSLRVDYETGAVYEL